MRCYGACVGRERTAHVCTYNIASWPLELHLNLDGVVHNKCARLTGGARTAYQGEQYDFMFEVPTDLASWKIKIKNAAFDNWAHEWQNNTWDCPALRSLLPDLRNHPGFLLANNRLDKQLARLRMNYVSLNGFLFRHGLAVHNYCEPCRATYNSMLIQSASHHLLNCPTYKHERASMFTTVNAILNRPTDSDVSLTDALYIVFPVGKQVYVKFWCCRSWQLLHMHRLYNF